MIVRVSVAMGKKSLKSVVWIVDRDHRVLSHFCRKRGHHIWVWGLFLLYHCGGRLERGEDACGQNWEMPPAMAPGREIQGRQHSQSQAWRGGAELLWDPWWFFVFPLLGLQMQRDQLRQGGSKGSFRSPPWILSLLFSFSSPHPVSPDQPHSRSGLSSFAD